MDQVPLRAVLDTVGEAIIAISSASTILMVNREVQAIWGYAEDELIGQPLEMLMPARFRPAHRAGLQRYLETGVARVLGRRLELEGLRKDGAIFPLELRITETRVAGDVLFTAAVRDITKRKEAEQRLTAQHAITRILAEATTLDDATPEILRAICSSLGWQLGALWRVDRQAQVLRCTRTWHMPDVEVAEFEEQSRRISFQPGVGLPGHVWATGKPVSIADFVQEATLPRKRAATHVGLHGAFGFPIRIGSEIFGVLEFFSREIRLLDEETLAMMAAVGSQIGQFVERRRAEEELHESEQRFRQLAQHIQEVFWMSEPHAARLLYISPAYEQVWGRTCESLYEQPGSLLESIHPEDRARFVAALERQVRGDETAEEYRVRRPDGTIRWIWDRAFPIRDEAGRVYRTAGVAMDITERKRAEEALRFLAEASALLAASLDYETTLQQVAALAVPTIADWCGVDVIGKDGTVQRLAVAHVDPAKVEMARALRERYPFDPEAPSGLARVLRTGRSEIYPEVTDAMLVAAARDDEHLRIMREIGFTSVMIVPLLAAGRTLGAISFVLTDPGRHYGDADLRRAEELAQRAAIAMENARLYEEAQASLRVRDEFLGAAAHELKTPLTVLMGNAQVLQRRTRQAAALPDREQRMLAMIVDQSARLNRLIGVMLDISRLQRGALKVERAPLDLRALVQRLAQEMEVMLVQHTLELRVPAEPVIVSGDELRLEQVLQNLLQNAIRYSPRGGCITVSLERSGEMASLAVSDQGMGIPSEALPSLFRPFYRAPNVNSMHTSGMGLGLYIVQEIVTLHDGAVEVESVEGQGSTFRVSLPLAAH